MKSFYNVFGTDPDLESGAGIVLDYGDAGRITIHRAGGSNKRFGKVLEAKLKPHRRQIDLGTMDDAVARRLMAEAYAEAVVIGWDGVADESGAEMPYSVENAVKLFLDLPDLFADVQAQANTIAHFRRATVQADAKNSETR